MPVYRTQQAVAPDVKLALMDQQRVLNILLHDHRLFKGYLRLNLLHYLVQIIADNDARAAVSVLARFHNPHVVASVVIPFEVF